MSPKGAGDDDAGGMRLARFLARAGAAPSRRKAEDLVREGRVVVNGVRVETMGLVVDGEHDRVEIDGRPIAAPQGELTLLYHKPAGVLVSRADPHQTGPTVYDQLPVGHTWAEARLIYAGRLDLESEGLLVLSTDGDLVHHMTHPSAGVEKEYWVRVSRKPTADELRRIAVGVSIADDEQPARAIATPLRAAVAGDRGEEIWLSVRIQEGRKRVVRRLLSALGIRVVRLVRVREGGLTLGGLPEGAWRELPSAMVLKRVTTPPAGDWGDGVARALFGAR